MLYTPLTVNLGIGPIEGLKLPADERGEAGEESRERIEEEDEAGG